MNKGPVAGITLILVSGVSLAGATAQSSPPRVDMNEALRQIIKIVEPIVPPEAAAARIGGTVVTEAIIRVNGTVESVRALAGPAPLHQAAIDAVKQWTFKPFLRNGKPARVMALLDVKFPDPAGDEAIARNRAAYNAMDDCRRAQSSTQGESVCADAARLIDQSAPREFLLRSSVHESYAVALLGARKPAAALKEFEIALQLRLQYDADENDADVADVLAFMAVAQMLLGDNATADATLLRAERAFEGALKQVPSLRDNYLPPFADVLRVHAQLKQRMGQTEAAAALERRAAELTRSAAPPPPPPSSAQPPTLRVVGGVQCLCAPDVDEAAMKRALASAPSTLRPWLVDDSFGKSFQLYGAASSTGQDFRAGPVSLAGPALKPGQAREEILYGSLGSWIQLPAPAPGAGVTSIRDSSWPIIVSWDLDKSPLPIADIAGLVRFMRSDAAKSVPAGMPSIQSWRIQGISHRGSLDFAVQLVDPASDTGGIPPPLGRGVQTVTVRKAGARWLVVRVE